MKGSHHLTFPPVTLLLDFCDAASKLQAMMLNFQVDAERIEVHLLCEGMMYTRGFVCKVEGLN